MPNLTPAPLSEVDYEAIEAAVMETARGRWFLAEYARRNRHADTTMLLKALERIEGAVTGERSVSSRSTASASTSSRWRRRSRAPRPRSRRSSRRPSITASSARRAKELDSVVQATEAATSDILACAERIQEIAWTLREQGLEPKSAT